MQPPTLFYFDKNDPTRLLFEVESCAVPAIGTGVVYRVSHPELVEPGDVTMCVGTVSHVSQEIMFVNRANPKRTSDFNIMLGVASVTRAGHNKDPLL